MRVLSIALFLALALTGCAAPTHSILMNQQTVDRYGRHEFRGAKADVYRSTLEALRALGYGVAQTDANAGQIRTDKHPFRTEEVPSYASHAWGAPVLGRVPPAQLAREYWITIREPHAGHPVVTANPYLYSNGQNVSGREIWDLAAERHAWDQLFDQIAQQLRRLPPTPRAAPPRQPSSAPPAQRQPPAGAEPPPPAPPMPPQPAPPPPEQLGPDANPEQQMTQPPDSDPAFQDPPPDDAPLQQPQSAWPDPIREQAPAHPRQPDQSREQSPQPAGGGRPSTQNPSGGDPRAPRPPAVPDTRSPPPPRPAQPESEYQNPFPSAPD